MSIKSMSLWLFPEEDFASWTKLVGETKLRSYGEYVELLQGLESLYAQQGIQVRRVPLTVAEMVEELAKRGWQNSPDNRAAVVGLKDQ